MNNNWNEAESSGQITAIHGYVVEALSAALFEWVWRGHEYVRSALPHRLDILVSDPARAAPPPATRWRIQASTHLLDPDGSPLAVLRLSWTRGELDWESLLSSAWLVAHEFVCHVQRLPPRDGTPRVAYGEDCPFIEGWMDEVAYGLFKARVLSGSAAGVPEAETDDKKWVRAHLDEISRIAADFRRERYGTSVDGKRHSFARQWELGAQAVRVILRFLATCTSYEQEEKRNHAALVQVSALSFRIQGATHSPDELRRIVNGCLLAGQSALSFMKTPEKARLLQLLTQPIPDLAVWSYKLEALCRTFPV